MHRIHQLDIAHVLLGDLCDVNIQNIQILTTDQIQQQIEGPLKGIKKHLERLRRNVEVFWELSDRLTANHCKGHLSLLGSQRRLLCLGNSVSESGLSTFLCGFFNGTGHSEIIPSGNLKVADVSNTAP